MQTRSQLDASAQPEVVDRDVQSLSELARASRPAPVETSSVTVGSSEPEDLPAPHVARQQLDDWIDGFDGTEDARPDAEVRQCAERRADDAEVAQPRVHHSVEPGATASHDAHLASELDDWIDGFDGTVDARPDAEVRHCAERRADDAEVAQPRIHHSDEPGATASHVAHLASELDDWMDGMEDGSLVQRPNAEVRHRVEQRADDAEVGRDPSHHSDEPGATALQDQHRAPAVPMAVSLAQLGDMDADLLRFGHTLDRSDAAFVRLVSRWHPVAVAVE